jgi:biopolymer transport protein ExbD
MAFGGFSQGSDASRLQSEINMVPLIDVMLVLLVIFIITAPLLTHAVKLDLPRATSTPLQTKPDHIALAIDASGALFWNGERIERPVLKARLVDLAKQRPDAELQLRADKTTQYQSIAEVMADAAGAGVVKIGFVSDPASRNETP